MIHLLPPSFSVSRLARRALLLCRVTRLTPRTANGRHKHPGDAFTVARDVYLPPLRIIDANSLFACCSMRSTTTRDSR